MRETLKDAAVEGMVNALEIGGPIIYQQMNMTRMRRRSTMHMGIGVTIESGMENGGVQIKRVQEGGAAYKGGLKAGEWIVAADGKSFDSLTLAQVKALISGEEGTNVTVTVRSQDGQQRDVTLTRSKIVVIPVKYQMLENHTGYIQIQNFDSTASQHAKRGGGEFDGTGRGEIDL